MSPDTLQTRRHLYGWICGRVKVKPSAVTGAPIGTSSSVAKTELVADLVPHLSFAKRSSVCTNVRLSSLGLLSGRG